MSAPVRVLNVTSSTGQRGLDTVAARAAGGLHALPARARTPSDTPRDTTLLEEPTRRLMVNLLSVSYETDCASETLCDNADDRSCSSGHDLHRLRVTPGCCCCVIARACGSRGSQPREQGSVQPLITVCASFALVSLGDVLTLDR